MTTCRPPGLGQGTSENRRRAWGENRGPINENRAPGLGRGSFRGPGGPASPLPGHSAGLARRLCQKAGPGIASTPAAGPGGLEPHARPVPGPTALGSRPQDASRPGCGPPLQRHVHHIVAGTGRGGGEAGAGADLAEDVAGLEPAVRLRRRVEGHLRQRRERRRRGARGGGRA